MGKARITKYKRRWKGKGGKWEYEYYDQKSRENKVKEKKEDKLSKTAIGEILLERIKYRLAMHDFMENDEIKEIFSYESRKI